MPTIRDCYIGSDGKPDTSRCAACGQTFTLFSKPTSALQPKEVPDYEAVARELLEFHWPKKHGWRVTPEMVRDVLPILKRHFPQQ